MPIDDRATQGSATSRSMGQRGEFAFEAVAAPWHGSPLSEFECASFADGYERIAGVDEVGRGPLAGPIVAAAVVLGGPVDGLNDSKLLTEAARDTLFNTLAAGDHAIGIAQIDAPDLDAMGLQNANYAAMARAAQQIAPLPDFLLVDGFLIRGCAIPQRRIVKGDRRSQSIAAASIVAKVTRDRIMIEFDRQYPGYGFARHKGYATREHLDALERLGPCDIHRRSFAPIARATETGTLFDTEVEFI